MSEQIRIAMWSGPRNISTALMRAWGNRPDTIVCDEPLYGHYLKVTGLPHPGAAEVIESQETDWRVVVRELTGEIPGGKRVYYQKHMAHHLLPEIERDWTDALTNCFLIRDPREMLTSLVKITPEPGVVDTGLPQQVALLDRIVERTGGVPPVIDARDVLEGPRRMLGLLCDAVGVEFDERMLSWPSGPRDTDGVWAKHWYGEVERSTGFRPYRPKDDEVPPGLEDVYEECLGYHERLHRYRLR